VLTIAWAGKVGRVYGRQNRRWRVAVKASQRARYVATIETLAGRRRLVVRGTLAPRRTTTIAFPRRRLAPGRYRIVVRSGSIGLRSPVLRVR
jgi:hypothetical protein